MARENKLSRVYFLISCYDKVARFELAELHKLLDQIYGVVIHQGWFKMRRYWLNYITHATKKVVHVFWKDEIEEKCGNLPPMHCVVALDLLH